MRKSAITPKEDGRWAHTARFVMKRPVAVVFLSLLILGTIASPIKDIVFSQVDTRVLPASDKAAIAAQVAAYVTYICPVVGAQAEMEKIDPELAKNPFIFPDEEALANVRVFRTLTPEEDTKYSEAFQAAAGN